MTKKEIIVYLQFFGACLLIITFCFLLFLLRMHIVNNREAEETIAQPNKPFTVILDAGHGGRDGGATANGIYEKDLNLQIVEKIKSCLQLYDLNVVLTRNDDNLLADDSSEHKKRDDLYNRVNVAKTFEDPLFVSIHMNMFPDGKYSGMQVFYSPNHPYSEALALVVKDNNKCYLDTDNGREVKKANSSIYVLDRLTCPAVMIECGFMSNVNELKNLCDEEYQNKLAFVISNSIIEYINL